MCLLLIAFDAHPRYRVVLAANRDEYYDRPTGEADFWSEAPDLLAGRDLRAGGTWLGVTRRGRIAATTNYRDPLSVKTDAPSRGHLVSGFLLGRDGPRAYLEKLSRDAGRYNGFNIIVGDSGGLYWYSNRAGEIRRLEPGIHGVSNRLLDTPWPKVVRGKKAFKDILASSEDPDPHALFEMLRDRSVPGDEGLPTTGVGIEWERILAPIFILSPIYGTRSSTVLMLDHQGRMTFVESGFSPEGRPGETRRFDFKLEP